MNNDTTQPFEERLLGEITKLARTIAAVDKNQSAFQTEISEFSAALHRQGIALESLKSSSNLQLDALETEMRNLGVNFEVINDKLDAIFDAMSPAMEKTTENTLRIDDHDEALKFHDGRLRALENNL